eukprot:TRINITY_DN3741_c0_g1_i2.p1 TRINITY_DN3741_c0_g1~~TRINITY_DN3741_c0_g1_i2.p1  ORF type:complete len:405 (-),score=153.99 TRINITY_DN3741_c0_g1_i2:8-1222(-)
MSIFLRLKSNWKERSNLNNNGNSILSFKIQREKWNGRGLSSSSLRKNEGNVELKKMKELRVNLLHSITEELIPTSESNLELIRECISKVPLRMSSQNLFESKNPFERKYLNQDQYVQIASDPSIINNLDHPLQIIEWRLDAASSSKTITEIWEPLSEKEKKDERVFNAYLSALYFVEWRSFALEEQERGKKEGIPLNLKSIESGISFFLKRKNVRRALESYHENASKYLDRKENEGIWRMFALYFARKLDKAKVNYWLDHLRSLDRKQPFSFYENLLIEFSLDSDLFFYFHKIFRKEMDPNYNYSLDEPIDLEDPFFPLIFFHYWRKGNTEMYSHLLSNLEMKSKKELILLGTKLTMINDQLNNEIWFQGGYRNFREEVYDEKSTIIRGWGEIYKESKVSPSQE